MRRSPLNHEKKQTKVKELTKMFENDVPCSNKFFFLLAGRLCSGGF